MKMKTKTVLFTQYYLLNCFPIMFSPKIRISARFWRLRDDGRLFEALYGIHSLVFVGEGWSIKVCKFGTRRKKCEQTLSCV